jgi:hypothetical protein
MVDAADSKSASERSESSSLSRRTKCSCGETGIRSRLKICQPQGFVSSTLTESTIWGYNLVGYNAGLPCHE